MAPAIVDDEPIALDCKRCGGTADNATRLSAEFDAMLKRGDSGAVH